MDSRYNIYYDGQVLEGQQLGSVRDKLAKLFKADQPTLDRLFSGKPQLIKKECDKATALKYKAAIEQAGGLPVIRKAAGAVAAQAAGAAAPTEKPAAQTESPAAEKTMTAAERIAALANAPDAGNIAPAEPGTGTAQDEPQSAAAGSDNLDLAPEGTEVLRPEERATPVIREIDTSELILDESGERLSSEPAAPPPAPETSHLSMGTPGETLPKLPTAEAPVAPDTDSLDLSPSGTDFSDCALPDVEAPALDLSAIELAPSGSDVLDESYRKKSAQPAPDTDHISLEE